MIALQKLWKMFFISSKKLFSFSRYSNFCNFFPYFPHCRFKRTNRSGIYWFWKKKYSKLFQGFLIVLVQNFLFLKEFIACNGYFGLFTKIKACVRYFLSNFISHQIIVLQKLLKMFFISFKKLFILETFKFLYFCLPLFSPLSAIALKLDQRQIL